MSPASPRSNSLWNASIQGLSVCLGGEKKYRLTNASQHGLQLRAEAQNLDFFTLVADTTLNTTRSDSPTTRDREDILDREQEGLVKVT